ncbi:MAG: dihydrofolate reductase family protein [Nanoarchaeota archaeon]
MRKIILFIATSLDGFIAGENGEIDWLFNDQDYGYKKFYDSVDIILMGFETYKQCLEFGEWPYKGKKCYVFTRKTALNDDNAEFINNPVEFTKKLKAMKGKDIWLVGGGKINSLFLNEKLLDEIIIYVHPIILGKGISLINNLNNKIKLKLINFKKYSSGLVQLDYKVLY